MRSCGFCHCFSWAGSLWTGCCRPQVIAPQCRVRRQASIRLRFGKGQALLDWIGGIYFSPQNISCGKSSFGKGESLGRRGFLSCRSNESFFVLIRKTASNLIVFYIKMLQIVKSSMLFQACLLDSCFSADMMCLLIQVQKESESGSANKRSFVKGQILWIRQESG